MLKTLGMISKLAKGEEVNGIVKENKPGKSRQQEQTAENYILNEVCDYITKRVKF